MQLCISCKESTVYEFYDRYDDEIYRKCRICGKIQPDAPKGAKIKPINIRKRNVLERMRKL